MEGFDGHKVALERLPEGDRKHGEAVFHALAVAHEDLVEREVDVLHAQAQALHEAQARAGEERRDEKGRPVEPREDGPHLIPREDDGQALRAFRADDVAEGLDGPLEDFAVEEEERAEGLGLGGGGHPPARGEMRDEGVDLGFAHFVGMPFAVEDDEPPDPADVGLFGPEAVVARAERGTHTVEELQGASCCEEGRAMASASQA